MCISHDARWARCSTNRVDDLYFLRESQLTLRATIRAKAGERKASLELELFQATYIFGLNGLASPAISFC